MSLSIYINCPPPSWLNKIHNSITPRLLRPLSHILHPSVVMKTYFLWTSVWSYMHPKSIFHSVNMTTLTGPYYIADLIMSKMRSWLICVNYNYWTEYLLNSLSSIDVIGETDGFVLGDPYTMTHMIYLLIWTIYIQKYWFTWTSSLWTLFLLGDFLPSLMLLMQRQENYGYLIHQARLLH